MAKTLAEAEIKSAAARKKCKGEGPHWRQIAPGVHLGYRRSKRGGSWLARWYLGAGKYRQTPLGIADDDGLDADGLRVLTFEQAQKATEKAASGGFADAKAEAEGKPETVRSAVESYAEYRDAEARRLRGRDDVVSDFRLRMTRHVLSSDLADMVLHKLATVDLQKWLKGMPNTLAAGTVRRNRNDLKAALNAAGKTHRGKLPAGYSDIIRDGLEMKGIARSVVKKDDDGEWSDVESQILADEQVRAVIAASTAIDAERGENGDLHRLVIALAATGMRLSQIARMRVGDVDVTSNTLHIPISRKGKGAEDREDEKTPRRVASSVIDALRPVLNRQRGAVLLEHRKMAKRGWQWEAVGRGSWESVELQKPWIAIRAAAGLPENVTPYALRHSSIVRMIMLNVPALLVAKRHNTSVEIIERHYARAIAAAHPERAEEVFEVAA